MDHTHVDWLADGFRVRFFTDPLGRYLTPELGLLYTLLGVGAAALHIGLAVLWCVPPVFAMWLSQWREASLTVTHSHVVAVAPMRRRVRLNLREVREVEVFDGELELLLWGGRRVRVPCWAPGQRLQWTVENIRQFRDEAQAFALDMAERLDDARRVKQIVHSQPSGLGISRSRRGRTGGT